MKELKRTVTTEETYGFEASDGTVFSSKEECLKYEDSANYVIRRNAKNLLFREWDCDSLFGGYCYDDHIKVWFIKDENHLLIINQYLQMIDFRCGNILSPEYIGNRVAVVVSEDSQYVDVLGTYHDILNGFTSDLNRLFADPIT